MRLLYLTADPGVPVFGHKGASVHVRSLVSALANRGASIVLASPRLAPEGERIEAPVVLAPIAPVLPKEHTDTRWLLDAVERQAAEIVELARANEVDAIYERYSLFSVGGARAARRLGVPHVLEVNAPLRDEAERFRVLPHPELAAALERETFASADRILAVSETLAELLVASGAERAKLAVVPNAVDPALFAPALRCPDPAVFTVGFAGSLKPWHGVDVLIEACRRALPEVPELRLEVIGDGPERELVKEAERSLSSVRYRGRLSHGETVRSLASWDVGAAPFRPLDHFYFSPLKLVEYMAAGACPVASDLPELRSLLGDGERGVLVEPGDAGALARVLVELAHDAGRAAALGRRAREHALCALSWAENARRVLDALRQPSRLVA